MSIYLLISEGFMNIKEFRFHFVFLFILTNCSSYHADEYVVKQLKNKPVEYVPSSDVSKKNLGINESLEEVKKAEKILNENENPVIIYELLLSRETNDKTRNKYSFLNNDENINYSSLGESGIFNSHAFDVTEAFMDTDSNGVVSDAEKNAFNGKNPKIKLLRRDADVLNAVGIINMSYSIVNHNKNLSYLQSSSKYLDKIDPRDINRLEDFLTTKLIDRNYVYNQRLLISAIGNGNFNDIKTEKFSSEILNIYQVMSPEMQALARSESIFVKNSFKKDNELMKKFSKDFPISYTDIDNVQYIDRFKKDIPQVYPLLLRSATVGENGLLKADKEGEIPKFGSSFSSPRIARLAYDIKEKYPFLTYQQVKQVILGTASHANDGYLSDSVGWGNANREKALKGPSDFNAGLIDEMKYFKGNYDKIFDEKGNRYFYVDIKKDKEYTFENDITSGLTGDGKSTEESIIKIKGVKNWYDYEYNATEHSYRIPKVLESEKLFYSNVAQAGLRKDGEGKLILTGKQEYSAPSQVLNGTLVLKNDSNSDYTVYEKGTLVVENIKENEDKEIKLKNIYTDGNVKIDSSKTSIEKLHGTYMSNVEFSGKEIKIKEFKTTGEYIVRLKEEDIKNINGASIGPKLTIDNYVKEDADFLNNLSNPFLKPVVMNDDKIVSVKFVSTLDNEFKKLGQLGEDKLKDIPSYDRNKKNFFEEYGKVEAMPSQVKYMLLSSSSSEAKNLFTDNYASIVGNVIKNEIDNKYNRNNIILNNLEKDNRLFFDTYARTNILNDKKFSPFVDNNIGAILGYSRKLKNGNRLDLYGIYQYGNVVFNNSGSNKTKSINHLYNIGYNLSKRFIDIIILDMENSVGYTKSDVYNNTSNASDKTNIIHSLSINPGIKIGLELNFDKIKTIFRPYAGYNFSFVLAWGKKDNTSSNTDLINKLRNIALTKLINHNVEFGIEVDSKINKHFSIQNRLTFDYNSLDKIELNQIIAEKLHKTLGKGLDKISVGYNLAAKLRLLEGMNVIGKVNINSKLNIGLNLGFDYNF